MNWKFDSDELNRRIIQLADQHDIFEAVPGSGKSIFYWGWAWRIVDLEEPRYRLAVNHDGRFAGFCENNKWGYPTYRCSFEQTLMIREALEKVATSPTASNFETVWNFMQASIPPSLSSELLALSNAV